MKTWIRCLACLAIAGPIAGSVLAQESQVTSPTMVAAGIRIVSKLKPLPPGETRAYYYSIMRGPDETIGYANVAITSKGIPGNVVYDYKNTWTLVFPTGDKIATRLTARLRSNFEPIEVDVWDGRTKPDGEKLERQYKAVIGKDKTVVTTLTGGVSETQELPRPEKPYISAIEILAALHIPTPGERFVIREFNAKSGKTRDLLINTNVSDDGTATLITSTLDGNTSYQFWYDESDVLIRWTEVTMPVMFVRVGKPRIDELKAQFGEVEGPASFSKKSKP